MIWFFEESWLVALQALQAGVLAKEVFDWLLFLTAAVFSLQVVGFCLSLKNERSRLVKCFGAMILLLSFPLGVVFLGYTTIN